MPVLLYLIAFVLLVIGCFAVIPVLAGLAGEPRFAGQAGTLALIILVASWVTAALLAGLASIGNRVGAQTKKLEAVLRELRHQPAGEGGSASDGEPEPKKPEDMTYPELVAHAKKDPARYRSGG